MQNTSEYTNLSLEELRKKQNDLKGDPFSKPEITEKEKEYWQDLKEKEDKLPTLDQIIGKAVSSVERRNFKTPKSNLNYDQGKKVAWEIMKTILEQKGEELKIDHDNKEVIQEIIKYFLGIECKYDLKKGIYLFGNVGRGKTFLLRVMLSMVNAINFDFRKFKIVSVKEIMFEISKQSSIAPLEKYLKKVYCFDDFGFEDSNFKLYGNEMPIMEYVVSMRYDKFIRSGLTTHITTNVPPEEITNIYGDRVFSRAKEMFNFVFLGGDDKRK